MSPKRIQRKRTAGWRMPADAIYVGRPTIWGNWARGQDAVEAYRAYLRTMVLGERGNFLWRAGGVEIAGTYYRVEVLHRPTWKEIDELRERLPELRNHDLCCWCRLDMPCHGDPLLEVANQ